MIHCLNNSYADAQGFGEEKKSCWLHSRVEWFSTFFRFSKTYTFLLIKYIFRNSIPKNRQFQPREHVARAGKFTFFKNQSDLKNWYFFWKFTKTFFMHQRTIDIKKIWNFLYSMIFYFTKMVKTQNCFWSIQGQNKYFFEYLFIFSPIKNQRIPSPHLRLQKGFKFFFLADFKVTVLNLLRPCDQGKRQH